MSSSGRVIKGGDEPEGPFSRMSVEPVLIGADGEVRRSQKHALTREHDPADNAAAAAPEAERRLVEGGLSLAEAREQAAAILELARQGAADLRTEAEQYAKELRAEVEAEVEERRASAVLEVSARLTQQYAEQYAEAVHALADAAVELKRRRDEYLSDIEEPAYQLVLALGRRLLGLAWENDTTLRTALRQALGLLRPEGAVRLYLNPATLQRARQDAGLDDVVRSAGLGSGSLELLADESLPGAAYRLDTGASVVRFNLEEALDELLRRLQHPDSGLQELKVSAPAVQPSPPPHSPDAQQSAPAEDPLPQQSMESAS
ncbi:hypothetical protein IT575_07760 [bacterium]|nr:hypothetical protein [bacterium]